MFSNTEIIMALLLIQNLSCCEEAEQKDDEMYLLLHSAHAAKLFCSFRKESMGDSSAALVQFDFSRFLSESHSYSAHVLFLFCGTSEEERFAEMLAWRFLFYFIYLFFFWKGKKIKETQTRQKFEKNVIP